MVGILAAASSRKSARRMVLRTWPLNVAHRGASFKAPENTLESFAVALEAGAGGLELDVHLTCDGRLVVIHDDRVDRTTDGTGAVAEMTLDQVRALDAGYRFSADGGASYPYRGRDLKIPTLEEVYRAFPGASVNVGMKDGQSKIEAAVLRVIEGAEAGERTTVASEEHAAIERFRKVSGGKVPTGASRREVVVFFVFSLLRLGWLVHPAYEALQSPESYGRIRVVSRRFVEAAHALGARVDVWTINDPSEMRRLLDLGVDTIMTDRPEVLAGVLEERT